MHEKIVAVLGAGTMGRGIAHVSAASGFATRVYDINDAAVEAAMSRIHATLDRALSKGKLSPEEREACNQRLSSTTSIATAVTGSDLVIEAAPENMDLKKSLYEEISKDLAPHTILASNTSALALSSLAQSTGCPDRFIGMHFFNPPYALRLLELIVTEATSEQTVAQTRQFAEAMNREIVQVKDSPGFATSRLGITLGNEATRMVEEGVAKADDIDRALRFGYGHPMGPLELSDLVGLDIRLAITEYLHSSFGSDTFKPPELLKKKVAAGHLGKKSGIGFYVWEDGKKIREAE
jgi:3-hydroxybutyryl-CoA dehydrogenase